MNHNIKKYLIWAAIAIVLYLIYRVISNRIENKGTALVVPPGGGIPTHVPIAFVYDPSKVVRTKSFGLGSKNSQEVGYLQTWLNTWPPQAGLKVDGDFGPKTLAALMSKKPFANSVSTTLDTLAI